MVSWLLAVTGFRDENFQQNLDSHLNKIISIGITGSWYPTVSAFWCDLNVKNPMWMIHLTERASFCLDPDSGRFSFEVLNYNIAI